MNLSTPGSTKPVEPLSILLIGPPGGNKSTLAMQFPFPGFLDCDRNLDGPERFVRKLKPDLQYGYVQITYKDGKPVPPKDCFDRLLAEIPLMAKEEQIKTIVLDGITLINNFIVTKVQAGREAMEIRDWGKVGVAFVNLLYIQLRQTGKNTIVTCHENPVERAAAGNPMLKELVKYEPAINGGIANTMSGLFTDVWRCSSEPTPGNGVQYRIQFTKDSKSADLKNSLGITQDMIIKQGELAWTKLEPYMKAYL